VNRWFVVGELERALCSRVVAAKGEVVEKGHTVEQAMYGRDALAKVRRKRNTSHVCTFCADMYAAVILAADTCMSPLHCA